MKAPSVPNPGLMQTAADRIQVFIDQQRAILGKTISFSI